MHTGQNVTPDSGQTILEFHLYAPDFGHVYAHRAIICPSFDTVIAHRAQLCLRFGARFCTPGIIVPRISGTHNAHQTSLCWNFILSLHTVHNDAPDFGQTSAPCAQLCLRFGADFWKTEVITLIFQTYISTSGTRCCKIHSYHRKTKMNGPKIQTYHAVSRIPIID